MTTKTPTTVAEIRAAMAEGCRQAAAVYRDAAKSGLPHADRWADRLDRDAERNDRLARKPTA
jgi:hypothetical protein